MMKCTRCGMEIDQSSNFCPYCGGSVPRQPEPVRYAQPYIPAPASSDGKKTGLIIGLLGVILLLVLTLAIVLVLTRCGKAPETPQADGPAGMVQPDPAPSDPAQPEESPAQPDPAPAQPDLPLVTDAEVDSQYVGDLYIPQINLEGSEIESINRELLRELYTDEIRDYLAHDELMTPCIRYHWAVNGDILSIVVESHPVPFEWTEYHVYNLSVSEGRSLRDSEVIEASRVADYHRALREAMQTRMWTYYEPAMFSDNKSQVDFFNEQVEKTCRKANLDNACPYLDASGTLCAVAYIYSLAGAEGYYYELDLEHYAYLPRYGEKLICTARSDDYIIADSDIRVISESELYGLSEDECWYALNEIYARHGRIFSTPSIASYFNSKPWYRGTIDGTAFDRNADSYLNSTEKKNLATIIAYQQKMGWRS